MERITCERLFSRHSPDTSFNRAAQARKLSESLIITGEHGVDKMAYDPFEIMLLSQSSTIQHNTSKIQLQPDTRNLSLLHSAFKQVSEDVLTRIWESNNQSWDACFDLLSSWVASHGPVLVSVDQLSFVLDAEHWPRLPHLPRGTAVPRPLQQITTRLTLLSLSGSNNSSVCSSGTSDGWSFCGMSDENESCSDMDDSWVDVSTEQGRHMQYNQEQDEGDLDECDVPVTVTQAPSPRARTFLEVLTAHAESSSQCPSAYPPGSPASKRPRTRGAGASSLCRPVIVCVPVPNSHKRRNVLYMDSEEMQNAPSWDRTYDDEEDEDNLDFSSGYGCWGAAASTKCFAQVALSNSLRARREIAQKSLRNQGVKTWTVLRGK